MKLRNKKTGKIETIVGCVITDDNRVFFRFEDDTGTYKKEYSSLAELNKEWEDYEESKGWYIDITCMVRPTKNFFGSTAIKKLRQCGNYFETKEEAEQAVEKLKEIVFGGEEG